MEKELTFLGMDGLLHCNVCKEALEVFYPQGSLLEGRKHHRQCACERKSYGIFVMGTDRNWKKLSGWMYCQCVIVTGSYSEDDEL